VSILRGACFALMLALMLVGALAVAPNRGRAQNGSSHNPTWWNKYTYIAKNGPSGGGGQGGSVNVGTNVDISNECGPQSETFIAINSTQTKNVAAGSNEIFRLPMRGSSPPTAARLSPSGRTAAAGSRSRPAVAPASRW
jgi:hypothetical protein